MFQLLPIPHLLATYLVTPSDQVSTRYWCKQLNYPSLQIPLRHILGHTSPVSQIKPLPDIDEHGVSLDVTPHNRRKTAKIKQPKSYGSSVLDVDENLSLVGNSEFVGKERRREARGAWRDRRVWGAGGLRPTE